MSSEPHRVEAVDYFALLHAHIEPHSQLYRYYVPHAACVTEKALRIARALGMDDADLRFIEEAAMLHDIGVVEVHAPEIGSLGARPYVQHIAVGGALLRAAGLPRHARVAETHIGVGITRAEIEQRGLALPARDFIPETLAEQVISYADLFFSKDAGKLWYEKPAAQVRRKLERYGERALATFDLWRERFEP